MEISRYCSMSGTAGDSSILGLKGPVIVRHLQTVERTAWLLLAGGPSAPESTYGMGRMDCHALLKTGNWLWLVWKIEGKEYWRGLESWPQQSMYQT